MKRTLLGAVAVSIVPIQTWAHEGHGVPGHGHTVAHYALDPLHLPLALLACAAAIWCIVQLRGRWSRVGQRS